MSSEQNKIEKVYVLDTSAVLAFREDEEGAEQVENLLRRAEAGEVEIYASFMVYMEAFYRIWQVLGKESARITYGELKALPIQQVDCNERVLLKAGWIKAKYRLSFADAWVIATALEKKAVLVHKDPEFEQVQELVEMLVLPYKVQ
ncbi:MAG: type II toxin-antitoxin system VapC family toxin [bacterium]